MSISIHKLSNMKQPVIDKSASNDESNIHNTVTTLQKQKRMKLWQTIVIITLFITYGCNYFTRNHIYVTTSQFRDYLDPRHGQKYLGIMYTVGQVGFFISKLIVSFLIDTKINSGVKPFAFGLIGVPICTIIIALSHTLGNIGNNTFRIVFIMIMWTLTMACQAPQWSGVIKIISDWIDYQYYGRVVSFMSLSYLAGDALTRAIFAYVLTINGMNNWENIFYFASVMTIIAVIPLLILVKDSPIKRGLNKPIPNPDNVYEKQRNKSLTEIKERNDYHSVIELEHENNNNTDMVNQLKESEANSLLFKENATKTSYSKFSQSKSWILLKPLLPQLMFYFIILFNVYLSILRTFFQMYSADYLSSDRIGANDSTAALISSLFPAMGVISAPLNGIWIDIMLKKNRNVMRYILFPIQGIMFTIPIVIIWYDENYTNGILTIESATVLILMCGFGICGCYAMLYVLSLDLGGDKSPTIVSGITDCAGLIGSMCMSFLSGFFGYWWLFGFLAIVGIAFIITSICLVLYAYCKS